MISDDPFDDLFDTGPATTPDQDLLDVIIVDDSQVTIQMVESMLRSIHTVKYKSFTNPIPALNYILRNKPALVITDQEMPQMTGIDMIRKIREVYDKFDVPVVMITGSEDEKVFETAYEAGVTDFIEKPLNHIRVVARVTAQLDAASVISALKAELADFKGA